jgi:hypothetical protein
VELLRLESRLSIRQFGASAIKLTGSPILSWNFAPAIDVYTSNLHESTWIASASMLVRQLSPGGASVDPAL